MQCGSPSDPCQGVEQRAAFDAKRATDRSLRGTPVQCRDHSGEFLGIDRWGTPAPTPPPTRCRKSGLHPFLDQRPLELRQRAEDMEKKLTLGCRGVHLLGQRTEGDAAFLEAGYRGEEVGQRSAEPVQLPDNQTVVGAYESKRLGQAGSVAATTTGSILKQVTLVDTGGEERVALQVQHLTVALGGDAHVADQHVRKTPFGRFPHSAPFRQGLSCTFLAINRCLQAPRAT